jgi:hypothetical protein
MNHTNDDLELRLAACRPRLSGTERDKLLVQSAQALERKKLLKQSLSYAALSSIFSTAACFGVMTYSTESQRGDNKIAVSEPSHPTRTRVVETKAQDIHPLQSESQLEISLRPRGVLTAASWHRWEAIEKQSLAQLRTPSEVNLGVDAAETKPLAVRSNASSL